MNNQHSIQIKEAKYLPPQSLVLKGSEVFSFFFDGVKFSDKSKEGVMVKCDLLSEWSNIQLYFDNVLIDITDL